MNLENIKFHKLLYFVLIIYFLPLYSSTKKSPVIWQLIDKAEDSLEINWEKLQRYKSNKSNKIYDDKTLEKIKLTDQINIFSNKINQIDPHLPLNNFLKKGYFDTTIQWKSSFSGGESKGIGQQNNSIRLDYGLTDYDQLSIYFAEADDNLFYKIKNKKYLTPYNWQNLGISFKSKIFRASQAKTSLSFVSTIEYMKMTSGSEFSKSIFNEVDSNFGRQKFMNIVGSFSFPVNHNVGEKLTFALVPGFNLLPAELGNKNQGKNSYGSNFYLGTGLVYDFYRNASFYTSTTFLLGPGYNSFDKNLDYSNRQLYSLGFIWEPSPILNFEGKVTNSFGSTPATGLLTIPSADIPLYYLGFNYKPYLKDINLKPLDKVKKSFIGGGLTLDSPEIPSRGKSQTWFNYDSKGNIFFSYAYSLSNIFQIELLSLGRFNDRNNLNQTNSKIRNRYLDKYNTNYRIGGKFLLLSPTKGDDFSLATRITVGRNDTTNQGYVYSELLNTYTLNNKISLNFNPKYLWSGDGTLGGIGFGAQYKLTNTLQFIPEYNLNLSSEENSNFNLAVRYSKSPEKSIDFYMSNAEGLQDIGELLKSKDIRFGFKLNVIY